MTKAFGEDPILVRGRHNASYKILVAATSVLLASCGGGDGSPTGGSAASAVNSGAAAPIRFAGSAALGLAIVNAPVTVKCSGGAQAVTTTSDLGRYSITLPAVAQLPCVLRVESSAGNLHAAVVAVALGSEVNITPLTDLQFTYAAGRASSQVFSAFTGAEAQPLFATNLGAAHTEVVNVFRLLLNLSGMRSFVGDALVAAAPSKGQLGNFYDQQLDRLNAALAAKGITYDRVAAALLSEKTGEKAALMLWGSNTAQGPVGTPTVTPLIPPITSPAPTPLPNPSPVPVPNPAPSPAPATTVGNLVTNALNAANAAIASVQSFIAATYNAFTNLGSPQVGPRTALAPAPVSTVNASNPKNWADTATWGGTVPIAGAAVVIPAGTTVVLNADTPNLGALTINGTLKFAGQDVKLTASNITINATGALMVGDAAAPFTNKAIITLTGARPSFPANRVIDNTRGITVLDGGKLELYGASPSPVWTQLNDHAAVGTRVLTLKDTTNWKASDNVIVGPTDYYGVNPTERFVLATTASGNNLATTVPLAKFRWGKMQYMTDQGLSLTPGTYTPPVLPAPTQLDQRAAVGNLSRNIVIQGANDTDWTNSGFGAHVMVMGLSSKVFVDGVEFRRVGQAGAMGRYPFHWHMLSYDQTTGNYKGDAVGQEIRNSAIWDSAQRCIVVHGTNGVKVVNNICHNITGHAMFLEDAVERRNVFDGNLVLGVKRPAAANLLALHEGDLGDAGSSGFWITNPDNTIRNNVVGDSIGNAYWNSFPTSGVGFSRKAKNPDLAGTQWANLQMNPLNMPHGIFHNNVGYSTAAVGVNTERMLDGGGPVGDDLGNTGADTYRPTVDGRPWDINGELNGGGVGSANTRATFSKITLYKTNEGYANRVSAPDYPEWVMSDVAGAYARGAGNDGAFFRGLFIGKSLNDKIGGTNTYPAQADPQAFFATYHSTFSMRDNTFAHVGFEEKRSQPGASAFEINDDRERSESGVFRSGDYYTEQMERGTVLNANNKFIQAFAGARAISANLLTANLPAGSTQLQQNPGRAENFSLAGAIWDPHGYWGNKGFYWTFDTPFYTSGGGCQPSLFPTTDGKNSNGKYNGQSCAGEFYGMTYGFETDLFNESYGENVSYWPMDVERVDCNPAAYNTASLGSAARACRQVVGSGWNSWKLGQMRGSSLRQGGKYIMRFPNPPAGKSINGDQPKFLAGIKQGTMVNAEGQTVPASIPKVLSMYFTNVTKTSDSFVLGMSFDGSKTPVGVIARGGGKGYQWLLPPNIVPGNVSSPDQARILVKVNSLAEVEADTTGTKMYQDTAANLVWVKVMGGQRTSPWYRIINFTAPFGQDLYNTLGIYIKDATIPNN